MTQARRDRALWAIVAVAVATLLGRANWYFPFFEDDAFISLRYAQRLLQGHGLTWNDGAPVEGYSNLLWILACAAVGKLGVDLVVAARVLGILLTAGTLGAIVMAHRFRSTHLAAVGFACIGAALTNTLAAWAIGGLEQPLFGCLLAWSLVLLLRGQTGSAGLLLGLLTLTRPDGAALAGTLAVALLVGSGARNRVWEASRALVAPALCWAGQLVFRLAYYGDWVPNTARVKVVPSLRHALDGARYLGEAAFYMAPLVMALAAALPLARPAVGRRAALLLFVIPAAVWSAYVALVGGDVFPAHRQFVPILVLGAFCSVEVLDAWLSSIAAPLVRWSSAAVLLALLGGLQAADPAGRSARWELWEWDGKAIGEFLHAGFAARSPSIATGAAGAVPFYSQLPTIDTFGLNDRWLATHPPGDIGHGFMGHELGNGPYVLSLEPDFILLGRPPGETKFASRSEREISQIPEFWRDYRLLFFAVGDPPALADLWTRMNSPRVGARSEGRGRVVPALLFARDPLVPARLLEQGVVGIRLEAGQSATADGIRLPAGRWHIEVEASAPVGAEVVSGGAAKQAGNQGEFEVAADTENLGLRVTAGGTPAFVRSVALRPAGPPLDTRLH